jgi:A/G-specific adenine glycosylase
MLQQTRVETVIPYFHGFLKAFPSVRRLSRASEDEVLKAWEGLGYYSRARNLHKAAKVITSDLRGRFPKTPQGWRDLPGIGAYTAAAITSIAFGVPVPAVDGNVKRVLARLFRVQTELGNPQTERVLLALAVEILAPGSPGAFNEAVMELGRVTCTPRAPACDRCPLRRHCQGFASNFPEDLPKRKKRTAVPHVTMVAGLLKRGGRVLIGRRPSKGMLGGLWEFPGGRVEAGETNRTTLVREMKEELGVRVRVGVSLGSVEHAYSHFSITLHLYECSLVSGDPRPAYHTDLKWVFPARFGDYAFPSAMRKLFRDVSRA